MNSVIAIRREDKNEWERRAPLTPEQVAGLVEQHGLRFLVQPSAIRAFADEDYVAAGAVVQEDITPAGVVLAIKEIPPELLQPGQTYLFFSHTIKGQAHNMPLLRRLLEQGCQLIDYELVRDEQQRRLLAFGRQAGLAGTVETLRALGQRLAWEGYETPLAAIKPAYQYADLADTRQALREVGRHILEEGWPVGLAPVVIGVAGYGQVAQGVQSMLETLPIHRITPAELLTLGQEEDVDRNVIYQVTFKEEHTVEPVEPGRPFNLEEFFRQPELYRSCFERYLPHLTVLMNCIYWDTPYPRLLTGETARNLYGQAAPPRLRVIGDISCDIEGAIEPTIKATEPDRPSFVWHPATGTASDGVAGEGPVIMAVDNLPAEMPIESSTAFGEALVPLVPALARCDFGLDFAACSLPPALKGAVVVYQGQLAPDYRYLEQFL